MKLQPIAQDTDVPPRAAHVALMSGYALDPLASGYVGEPALVDRTLPPAAVIDFAAAGTIPLSSPATDAGASRARLLKRDSGALRTVLNVLGKWGVSGERAARLLGVPKRTMYGWAKNVGDGGSLKEPLGVDALDRLSYILGIWKASMIVLPSEAAAIKFMQSPNFAPVFGGRSPLERMLDGRILDLAAVRAQFDGWRGG